MFRLEPTFNTLLGVGNGLLCLETMKITFWDSRKYTNVCEIAEALQFISRNIAREMDTLPFHHFNQILRSLPPRLWWVIEEGLFFFLDSISFSGTINLVSNHF